MVRPYWLVWCPERGPASVRHHTKKSATDEAERLANKHPGSAFHLLELVGQCRSNSVVWEEVDNIPF